MSIPFGNVPQFPKPQSNGDLTPSRENHGVDLELDSQVGEQATPTAGDASRRAEESRLLAELSSGGEHRTIDAAYLRYRQEVKSVVGGVIHDFNNLLLVMSYSVEQLQNQFHDDDQNRSAVLAISNAREQAVCLAKQLHEFIRDPAERYSQIDLNDSIVRADPVLRSAAHKNVIVRFNLVPGSALVEATPDQVDQILVSLFLNARDSMPEGGWLTIETGFEDRTSTTNNTASRRFVRLQVSDTGGTASFVPDSESELDDGLLVRLKGVQAIVKHCDGRVVTTKNPESGTSVEVLLPEAELQTAPDFGDIAGTETILIVEDETEIRKILRTSLESHGYKVIEAAHGPGAIAAAFRYTGPIHLLITDVAMPEMSGPAVAEALQGDFPGLPALYISGIAGDSRITHATSNSEQIFIQKPFKSSDLLMKVRGLLDRRDHSS